MHTVYPTSHHDNFLRVPVSASVLKALSKCESFTLGKEVCASCSPIILGSYFSSHKLPNLSHVRLSLPLETLDVVQVTYPYYRPRVRKRRRSQVDTLGAILLSLSRSTTQRVKTLHLETRCERKGWGGLCHTGNSSNDPKAWFARTKSVNTEDKQEEDLDEDAEMADIDVHTEGAPSASQGDMAESTMGSPVPEDDDGESDSSPDALPLRQRRLYATCIYQRRTMLSQHLEINRLITRHFKSLEELRVYRAGSSYIELMKEDEDLVSTRT